jgi:hypothetical protein
VNWLGSLEAAVYRVVVALLLCVNAMGVPALAQEVTFAPATSGYDLAAMTLTPSELDSLGLSGFGLANQSSLRDAATDALVQADGDALQAASRLAVYEENGFRARYVGSLLRPIVPLEPLSSGLVAADMRISTSVTEFSNSEGAAATFAFNEGEMDDTPGEDVPGTREFGDESELTRSTGTEPTTGEPLQRLELAFRLDSTIAEVNIVVYENVEPEIAAAEQLGAALLAKIELGRANADPGLSTRVLRLSPMAPWIQNARLRDFYTRRDRVSEPTFPQIVDAIRDDVALDINPSALDEGVDPPVVTYMFWSPVGEGDPLALPLYVVWINQYASPAQAAAAVAELSTDLGPGYVDVLESLDGTVIGDESRAFSYRYEGDTTGAVQGHLVTSRLGDIVVHMQVDGPQEIAASGVSALASAQLACLESQEPCQPMPALRALTDLVAN